MSANIGYRPLVRPPSATNAPTYVVGGDYEGSGTPEGTVIAPIGSRYCDTVNDKLYLKVRGSNKYGWIDTGSECPSGTGTGTGSVYTGTGSPEGVVTAEAPAMYYTANGGLWQKTNTGLNNTGWLQIIAE